MGLMSGIGSQARSCMWDQCAGSVYGCNLLHAGLTPHVLDATAEQPHAPAQTSALELSMDRPPHAGAVWHVGSCYLAFGAPHKSTNLAAINCHSY